MFDKLDFITEKYNELAQKVSDPAVIANQPVWQKHVKEMGDDLVGGWSVVAGTEPGMLPPRTLPPGY